nr:hypothetical protein [Sinorhizobium meliloti]
MTDTLVTILILIDDHRTRRCRTADEHRRIEATAAAALLGLGIGTINIVMFARFPLYEQIFSIVNRPVFMISGVFLPESLPNPFRDFLLQSVGAHHLVVPGSAQASTRSTRRCVGQGLCD